ncbi:hypothetical protein ACFY3J_37020 [Streptomyces sp. NPDC001231]|uniref:hypothetical protein n=1 Tax=Streptomyces sp. NPDC001231 TaxID=3364549 RepID=UPI0036C9BA44
MQDRTPDAVRDLLAVVLDALALPYDTPDYDRRILDRAAEARTVATAALAEDPRDIAWNVDYLRGKLPAEEAEAAKREAVRRSVDAQFAAVAAFLEHERSTRGGEGR